MDGKCLERAFALAFLHFEFSSVDNSVGDPAGCVNHVCRQTYDAT